MSARVSLLAAALALVLGLAVVWEQPPEPDLFALEHVEALLAAPVQVSGPARVGDQRSLFEALLEHPAVTHTDAGTTLRLGRVLGFPTTARLAAESAGELLELEVETAEGRKSLWRAILSGPATQDTPENGRALALYGCRHSADPAAGPVLEDSYFARLALARALEAHARAEPAPVTILGQEVPRRGGVNFEVVQQGEEQILLVTFDGCRGLSYEVRRPHRPLAPNDARARIQWVAALRAAFAARPELGPLVIEGELEPVAGLYVRIEPFENRLALVAEGTGVRLSSWIALASGAQ